MTEDLLEARDLVAGYLPDNRFREVVDASLEAQSQLLSVPRSIDIAGVQPHLVWRRGQRFDVGYGFSSVHADRIEPACRTPGDKSYAWWVQPGRYGKSGQ